MGIFERFRRGGAQSAPQTARIDETVERLVQVTNPRLRLIPRYRARLKPAAEAAMRYAHDLVALAPAAREASPTAWAGDPYLRAFFATADEIIRVYGRSADLRAHFDRNPGSQEAYAVLSMQMIERKVLGVALEGEAMRSDVAQTTVSFGDYRVRICGRTESELRAEIERRVVDQLALEGLVRVGAEQSRRETLAQERALLTTRLKLMQQQGVGMRAVLGAEVAGATELARLQSQIDENGRNLTSLGSATESLDRELELICEVLAQPREHFKVSSRWLRLDRMNVVLEEGAPGGTDLEFPIAHIPATSPPEVRTFMLTRFARVDLPAAGLRFDEAAGLL
ncbi:MAG TPA: hypothetical protein VEG37_11340 [Burkholderiales bacterium]|nr:hypothetical protein [Burkholderiales bacterium]